MAEDLQIIERVLQGDTESFRHLVERYAGPVMRLVRNVTGDSHSCEDIAQEVFLATYVNLAAFDPRRSRFSTWLFTIAHNLSINAARKKRPVYRADVPDGVDPTRPDEAAADAEFMAALDRELLSLPLEQRAAFVLAEFDHLPYEAIARLQGVRVGTVKSRINRARHRLMQALEYFAEDTA